MVIVYWMPPVHGEVTAGPETAAQSLTTQPPLASIVRGLEIEAGKDRSSVFLLKGQVAIWLLSNDIFKCKVNQRV